MVWVKFNQNDLWRQLFSCFEVIMWDQRSQREHVFQGWQQCRGRLTFHWLKDQTKIFSGWEKIAGQVKFLCCTGDDFMTYCASVHGLMKSPEDAFRDMCSCFDPTAEAARSASTETTGQTLSSAKRQIKPSESERSCSFTSLNSGLSVFFFTAVLCFDFLFSSGFRYLQQSRDVRLHQTCSTAEQRTDRKQPGHWLYTIYYILYMLYNHLLNSSVMLLYCFIYIILTDTSEHQSVRLSSRGSCSTALCLWEARWAQLDLIRAHWAARCENLSIYLSIWNFY